MQLLEERFGSQAQGCACTSMAARTPARTTGRRPGFQGTTVRDEVQPPAGLRIPCGQPRPAGRRLGPLFKRVPTEELDAAVVGLVQGWVGARGADESFRSFCDRSSDGELSRLAGREAASVRGAA